MEQPIQIAPAAFPDDLDDVRAIFAEYADWLNIDLGFQGFAAELERLPGEYAPPTGCLLLAHAGDRLAGVIGLRPFDGDVGEAKRLYIRAPWRRRGLGRALTARLIDAAREAGYGRLRLDTLGRLPESIALYSSLGFHEIPPYRENPHADAVYLELVL